MKGYEAPEVIFRLLYMPRTGKYPVMLPFMEVKVLMDLEMALLVRWRLFFGGAMRFDDFSKRAAAEFAPCWHLRPPLRSQ